MPVVDACVSNTADCSAAVLSKTTVQKFVTLLNVPRLKPTVCVASGPTDVSVAFTSPPVCVTNENTTALVGFSRPVNVSVVVVDVGRMGLMVVVLQPLASATRAANPIPHALRPS